MGVPKRVNRPDGVSCYVLLASTKANAYFSMESSHGVNMQISLTYEMH